MDVVVDKGVVSETTVPVADVEASRTSAVDANFDELNDQDEAERDAATRKAVAELNVNGVKKSANAAGRAVCNAVPNDAVSLKLGQSLVEEWRKDAALSPSQGAALQRGYDERMEQRLAALLIAA